jgi:hypothetical protein
MKGAHWFQTCQKCKYRRSWTGELRDDPGCPKCNPKKGISVAVGELSESAEEAVAIADEALELIDDLPDAAYDFGESVKEKIESIRSTIIERDRVTDKQFSALENMKAGIERWLDH